MTTKIRLLYEEGRAFMGSPPLEGLNVIDIAVLVASPAISQNLGYFGAEAIKIGYPQLGDSLRTLGAASNGVPFCPKEGITADLPESAPRRCLRVARQ